MDPVLLARLQFAITIGFHFIFPPITIGLAWLLVYFMRKYMKTGEDYYRSVARFWLRIFVVSFVVGVATGIVMEFQFGTNWSQYSRFVGDIFGAPLAAEGIFTFFLESTFIAVLIFGWDRVSKKALWFASLMVAVGATLSAFWIIVANSWQQTPAGYHMVEHDGMVRAELTDFFAAVFNASTIPRYLHTIDGALITGSFFMLGIAAWFILKNRNVKFAMESVKLALIVGFIASALQLPLGHAHAVQVALTQPEKLATFEGLYETQTHAPALLFGIPDPENDRMLASIEIPGLLSWLIYMDAGKEVMGLDQVPKEDRPPILLTFWPFHLMVYLGLYFIAFTGIGILLLWFKKLEKSRWWMWLALVSISLPIITNELGWIAAEVGRQPWIVYKLLRTEDAVSISVSAGEILFSIVLFSLIYILLFFVWIFLLRKEMNKGPEDFGASGEVLS